MGTERFRGALLSALVIASLMVPAISLLSVSPSSAAPDGLTPRDPIYIYGNVNFTPANGVNGGGSGTENDPYIIENWDISAENAHGIEIRNTDAHFVIRNCVVENGRGVYYNGIYLYNVINGRVENCISENNYHGIYLHYSDNNTLINNICSKNYHGIYLHYSDNNTLDNNTCENNGWAGILLLNSPNNTLDNNTCKNNFAAGFFLWNSDNNTLHKNICENDYRGIWLDNSVHNALTNNTCENNDLYGIYLQNSDNNCIYHNNFVNNSTHAYDDGSNDWDNGYPSGGNYWSDYTGADNYRGENQDILGSDGIGDTPYNIPGGANQDRYPLMSPWTGAPVVLDDTYVNSASPDANYGSSYLLAGTESWGSSVKIIFIKFDISEIGGEVLEVKLWLKLGAAPFCGNPETISAYEVLDQTWSEDTLTYSTMPELASTPEDTVSVTGTPTDWYYWSVTNVVKARLAENSQTVSIALKGEGPGQCDKPFYSKESAFPPYLEITSPELPVIPATIDVSPDTLNLKSRGRWITCFIELPEGYDVADIDIESIRLNGVVPAEPRPTGIGGKKLMAKFSRPAVHAIVSLGEVELTVTGLVNGMPFEGNDTIRVIEPGKVDLEARFMDISFYWSQADPAGKLDIETEFMEIPFYWAQAPD